MSKSVSKKNKREVDTLKNGKKLTVAMKELLKEKGLNPEQWMYVKNVPGVLTIVDRQCKETKEIRY